MLCRHIKTYGAFKSADRPYNPLIANGKLVIVNITVNHSDAYYSAHRLIITSTVVLNRGGLAAVHVATVSNQGWQQRWFYFKDGSRVTWHALTWDERRKIVKGYINSGLKSRDMKPPTRKVQQWEKYL